MRCACVLAVIAGCGFAPGAGSAPSDAGRDGSVDAATDASGDAGSDAPDAGPSPTSPRKLVFGNPTATDLVDFPVLVVLDPSRIDYSQVIDPQRDLRFEDGGTTNTLKHQVEYWEPGGRSIVWVEVPQIDAMSQTDFILMYWGASLDVSQDAPAVWSQYEMVIHLGGSLVNSRNGGKYNATQNGALATGGVIGGGTRFADATDSLTFSNGDELFDAWGTFTLEYWIRLDYANAGLITGEPRVLGKDDAVSAGRILRGPDVRQQIDFHYTSNSRHYAAVGLPLQAWTHVAWAYDNTVLRVYRNGELVGTHTNAGAQNLVGNRSPLVFGHSSNAFRGDIDELRIGRTAFTDTYFEAQYLSMTDQLITFTDP